MDDSYPIDDNQLFEIFGAPMWKARTVQRDVLYRFSIDALKDTAAVIDGATVRMVGRVHPGHMPMLAPTELMLVNLPEGSA